MRGWLGCYLVFEKSQGISVGQSLLIFQISNMVGIGTWVFREDPDLPRLVHPRAESRQRALLSVW